MTIALVGEVCTDADTAGDFTTINGGANISGDDDNVEGTGAIGDKMSNTTEILASDNLSGGASGVYDFSSGGSDEGKHIIGWVNTRTPVNSTTGIQTYLGNASGHNGVYNNLPTTFYKGGFVTRVINPELDFTTANTWTTTGNPAQLDDVSEIGFQFTTTTSIMGNFNNCQVDQIVVGTGIRADVGTSGTPNQMEDVRSTDEDTNFWGWCTGVGSQFTLKGKLFIGPASGTTASWFVDEAFSITFADEQVDASFYEINARGANTTLTWTLASISSAVPGNQRWTLTIDSALGDTTGGFTDTNGVWSGSASLILNSNTTLTGTSIIDGSSMIQNDAVLDSISVLDPDVLTNVAFLEVNDLDGITDSTFESNGVGHAIEYVPVGAGPFTETLDGNTFTDYAAQGGTAGDRSLYINPDTASADITINIQNGSTPSYRLDGGYTGTFTILQTVTVKVTVQDADQIVLENVRVLLEADVGGDLPADDVVTITRSGSTASVSHTSHGLADGDVVAIRDADQGEYNGTQTITNVTVNAYDYTVSGSPDTPATGTITSTVVILDGLTNVSGIIQDTAFNFGSSQPVRGVARMSTNTPFFKSSTITGSVESVGFTNITTLLSDE